MRPRSYGIWIGHNSKKEFAVLEFVYTLGPESLHTPGITLTSFLKGIDSLEDSKVCQRPARHINIHYIHFNLAMLLCTAGEFNSLKGVLKGSMHIVKNNNQVKLNLLCISSFALFKHVSYPNRM